MKTTYLGLSSGRNTIMFRDMKLGDFCIEVGEKEVSFLHGNGLREPVEDFGWTREEIQRMVDRGEWRPFRGNPFAKTVPRDAKGRFVSRY